MDVHSSLRIKGADQDEELGFLPGCYGKPFQWGLTCSDRHFGDSYFGGYREMVCGGVGTGKVQVGDLSTWLENTRNLRRLKLETYSFLLLAVSP